MSQSDDLLGLLDGIVARATPGEGVEAYGVDATETTVKAYDGQVESLASARTRGVGIRLIADARVGYAYSAALDEAEVAATLEAARANAAVASPDEANVLPPQAELPTMPQLWDPRFEAVDPADKTDLAIRLEAATRAADSRIKGVDTATYGDSARTVAIASTKGLRGAYRRCDAYLLVEALAEADGATTSAYGLDLARVADDLDVGAAAAEAAVRATRLLGGRKPPSRRLAVVLDPFATASFLGVLAGALTAEAVQKGRSLFAGKLSERIGAERVTLVDDGRLLDGPAAAPWDAEGVPTGRTTLVADGVLVGYLHNAYTAAKAGTTSTGNASRGSFTSPPGISPTNLFLRPGPDEPETLLALAGSGFYCQQVLGVHSGANPISGDFSVGVAGVMVRDGQLAEPVREATIASTIPDMLQALTGVGSDLRFLPFGGGIGGTTLLIDGMTLSGA
ncbi:MAG TPA: TldD/PmbA family protein [Egibacteraceae bacterium]|nr:TldD/PmbA family protein [Egibacteraceae bacterium]